MGPLRFAIDPYWPAIDPYWSVLIDIDLYLSALISIDPILISIDRPPTLHRSIDPLLILLVLLIPLILLICQALLNLELAIYFTKLQWVWSYLVWLRVLLCSRLNIRIFCCFSWWKDRTTSHECFIPLWRIFLRTFLFVFKIIKWVGRPKYKFSFGLDGGT